MEEEQRNDAGEQSENGYVAFVPSVEEDDDECCDHAHDHVHHHHDGPDHECTCGHDPDDPDHDCCGKHHHGECDGDECCDCEDGEGARPVWHEPAFSESRFEHDGVGYHIRRWGDPGQIPLVLLHGFMQSGDGWWVVAPHLAQDHCVYAFDLVGHGLSDRPENPEAYTVAAEADAVAAFIEEVVAKEAAADDEKPGQRHRTHLLGYSMGGRVALEVALMHGDLLYSLILESAGFGPADEEERAAVEARDAEWVDRLREGDIESFVSYWESLPLFATQQRLPEPIKQAVRAERSANDAAAMARVLEGMGQHAMRSRDENLAMLDCVWMPVLYLAGTRDEKYRDIAEGMLKQGFDAKALMGGHNTHLEVPEYFLNEVSGFFTRVEVRNA